ncbi:hypothetical protein ACFL6B_05615 [Thermodesulfobacteriota bacterium]
MQMDEKQGTMGTLKRRAHGAERKKQEGRGPRTEDQKMRRSEVKRTERKAQGEWRRGQRAEGRGPRLNGPL